MMDNTPIVTITLNPAVDKSSRIEILIPDQKLKCEAPKYEPGGGGINVSRALKRLGTDSVTLFLSGGRTGARLEELLEKEEIEQRVIETRNETRENFIVVDVNSNQQYRFGLPGSQIYQNEEEKIIPALRRLSPGWIVVSGSLPPGMKPEILANIATLAKDTDAKLIIDTSGDALHYAVDVGVFLLKPNLGELSKLIGRETVDNEAVDEAAKELISRGKCEMVVVSMGPQGAHLVTKDIAEHIPAPAVKKMSTVGAGDSMVAGMVHALYHGWSLPDVVRMGVACGSAATMNPGTELFKKEDVEKLYLWLSRSKVITF